MKQQIEIYLHGAGTTEEKIIKIPEDATVHDVLEAARKAGFVDPDLEIHVEEGEEALNRDLRLCDCGVKHKHHLHCHTCRKIDVTVQFNGTPKTRKFGPARKVKAVLKWALEAHGLHGVDADNKELRLGGTEGEILQPQQHIGSFAHDPHCHVELYLTAIVEVQG